MHGLPNTVATPLHLSSAKGVVFEVASVVPIEKTYEYFTKLAICYGPRFPNIPTFLFHPEEGMEEEGKGMPCIFVQVVGGRG